MSAESALRFLAHEAQECRDKDAHEALCLLFPSLLHVLSLEPMNGYEASEFRLEFHAELKRRLELLTA